jgi:predicted DNA-binding transcriptional regulator AlpA
MNPQYPPGIGIQKDFLGNKFVVLLLAASLCSCFFSAVPMSETTINTTRKRYLTRAELAERWSCSISTLKRLEEEEGLKAVRLGKRFVRYSLESIEEIEKTR